MKKKKMEESTDSLAELLNLNDNDEAIEQEESKDKPGLFTLIDVISCKKTPWSELSDDYKKIYSQYIINRLISSNEIFAPLIAEIACKKMSDEEHYLILCNLLNRAMRYSFNFKPYKKSKPDRKDYDELIYAVRREYEVGMKDARFFINNLKDEELDYLKTKWASSFEEERKL